MTAPQTITHNQVGFRRRCCLVVALCVYLSLFPFRLGRGRSPFFFPLYRTYQADSLAPRSNYRAAWFFVASVQLYIYIYVAASFWYEINGRPAAHKEKERSLFCGRYSAAREPPYVYIHGAHRSNVNFMITEGDNCVGIFLSLSTPKNTWWSMVWWKNTKKFPRSLLSKWGITTERRTSEWKWCWTQFK